MSSSAGVDQHSQDVVRQAWLFHGLSPAAIPEVAALLERREVAAGETVIVAGDWADALYLIEEGRVVVETPLAGGAGRPVAQLGAGEFFGEGALTHGALRSATVRARTPLQLWRIPKERLADLISAHPSVGDVIARTAALRAFHRASAAQAVDEETLGAITNLSPGSSLTIGRAHDNNIVLDSALVSQRHATITRTTAGLELHDRSSHAATYVNGAPVSRVLLKEGDHISFGDVQLRFAADEMTEVVEPRGIRIDAIGLRKDVSSEVNLIKDITLRIGAGEFVAIVGGSGAGKSTLMDALSGVRPPSSGTVSYNGIDAIAQRERFRASMGYVPQDDIIHRDLTVTRTLDFAARLRLPDDTPAEVRNAAVHGAIEALQLLPHAETTVSALSGGQRKRASIGVELLTEPKVFFLDEPTSGLDPATDTALMQQLRDLSRRGSTVVLTTHATKNVRLCDRVIVLATGGHLAFTGSPAEALTYFQVGDFDEIYTRLAGDATPADWGARFRATHADGAVDGLALEQGAAPAAGQPGSGSASGIRPRRVRHNIRQFSTLSRRNAAVFIRNRDRLAPLIIQPIAFALLMVALFQPNLLRPDAENLPTSVLLIFMLPFSVFLFGLILGVQEIVTEFGIFRRERLVGVRVAPYVLSKVTLLLPALAIGSALMLLILRVSNRLPALSIGSYGLLLLTMTLSVAVGLALALFTSAFAPNPQAANDLVLAWVMPQVLFAGGLFPIASMINVGEAISVAMPLRYGLQASADIVNLTAVWEASQLPVAQTLLATYGSQFDVSLGSQLIVLAGVVVAFFGLTMFVLGRRVPR